MQSFRILFCYDGVLIRERLIDSLSHIRVVQAAVSSLFVASPKVECILIGEFLVGTETLPTWCSLKRHLLQPNTELAINHNNRL